MCSLTLGPDPALVRGWDGVRAGPWAGDSKGELAEDLRKNQRTLSHFLILLNF